MITTITLNPCIDKMVSINSFTYGGMNRVLDSEIRGSGKGINVAIALNHLGRQAICTGINYRDKGFFVHQCLDEKGIDHDFIMVEGEVRTNYKIYDRSKQIVTELNEKGHRVKESYLELLKDKLIAHCDHSKIMVLSGSVPEGVPSSIYREILKSISGYPIKTILDTYGSLLLEGLKESPYIIKPNLYELERTLDVRITSHGDIVRAAQYFIEKGVRIVCVSLGGDGAIIVDEEKAYHAPAVDIDAKGTVGAGDSMVAGFCMAIEEGLGLEDILRYGVAAATASVMREGILLCTREGFDYILPKVKVKSMT
ncbi:MAG TPA: 1-phosphofructokinase [Clostridia bacterium]|nr:1-phosphofructokinase [Clostridia bacterium]